MVLLFYFSKRKSLKGNNPSSTLRFQCLYHRNIHVIKEIKSSDKELDQKNVTTIILNYAETEKFPRNEIPIYTDFMEQVIIPNIVIDEQATKITLPICPKFLKKNKIIKLIS